MTASLLCCILYGASLDIKTEVNADFTVLRIEMSAKSDVASVLEEIFLQVCLFYDACHFRKSSGKLTWDPDFFTLNDSSFIPLLFEPYLSPTRPIPVIFYTYSAL